MWADNETTQDLLGYQVHADLLKKIVLNDEMLPLTIGVFGNWGSGKSSLMLLMEQGLKEWQDTFEKRVEQDKSVPNKAGILQIRFNSWQFDNYESNKLSLIDTILTTIRDDIKKRTSIFTQADTLLSHIKWLEVGSFVLNKIYSNLVPEDIKKWLPNKEELDKMAGREEYRALKEHISNGNSIRYISMFRRLFEQLITDADYKSIIVYIDDLDRCKPEKIIDCLEAVKLFVNVKHTAFVIGADQRIIEYAINRQYPIQQQKEEISSPFSDYLEKLIQLPYKIPKLSQSEQRTYLNLLLCQRSLTNANFNEVHKKYLEYRKSEKYAEYTLEKIKADAGATDFSNVAFMEPVIPLITEFLNGNPRQLKRFMNTLDVRIQLADVAGFHEVKPEILAKLMILEYNSLHRSRFEDLYKRQKEAGGFLAIEQVEKEAKEKDEITIAEWKENWSSPYLVRWMKAEPSLDKVDLQNYFWVARDAIENETPIDSLVTNRVQRIYRELGQIQLDRVMEARLPGMLKDFTKEEYGMLILLLNSALRANPSNVSVWRILNGDASNMIIAGEKERLQALFNRVDTLKIDPQANSFFARMLSQSSLKSDIEGMKMNSNLQRALKYSKK